jgi:5'-nucleotidase
MASRPSPRAAAAPTNIRDIDALTSYLVKREQDKKPAGAAAPLVRYKSVQ